MDCREEPQSNASSEHQAERFKKETRNHPSVSTHFSSAQGDISSGGGHMLGSSRDGGAESPMTVARKVSGESQHLAHQGQRSDEFKLADNWGEAMETEEREPDQQNKMLSHSDPSDDDDDDDDDDPSDQQPPLNFPALPPNLGLFGRNMPPPLPQPRRNVHFAPPMMPPFMGGDEDELFGGEGHRLGGKEVPMAFGDPQMQVEMQQNTGGREEVSYSL